MDPVFVKKGPSFMNNSIRTILGVKDPYLKRICQVFIGSL
ncbi:transposase [Limosilactobacillus reuteri]|uniref:Transposase n=1 Tax=Limosilactobacillus reuteri TaxID=1598 RepID=A0A2S1EQE5_LIMRT|nr:transposase [Limosilactobacillus reuteri]